MSATTNALNVGAAALPLVGPPKIVFAVLVVVLSKSSFFGLFVHFLAQTHFKILCVQKKVFLESQCP